jgi:hypothetical protein
MENVRSRGLSNRIKRDGRERGKSGWKLRNKYGSGKMD